VASRLVGIAMPTGAVEKQVGRLTGWFVERVACLLYLEDRAAFCSEVPLLVVGWLVCGVARQHNFQHLMQRGVAGGLRQAIFERPLNISAIEAPSPDAH